MSHVHRSAIRIILIIGLMLTSLFVMNAAAQEQDRQNQAAQDWLDLIDQGQYQASWNTASAEAKARIASQAWQSSVSAVRGGLGERLTRGLETRQEAASFEDWPAGEYAILTFSSSFANRAQALEKLVLKKDPDGQWRVIQYTMQ